MSEERRQSSIESLLVGMGELKQITSSTASDVKDLNIKVGIQNGRIGKIETSKAYFHGVVTAIMFILTVIIVPLLLEYVKRKAQ